MSVFEMLLSSATSQRQLIERLQSTPLPVVLYGAGVYAYVVRRFLALSGVKVSHVVVDAKYKTQDTFMDLKVSALENCLEDLKQSHLVIGITDYPKVVSALQKLGIEKVYPIDIPDYLNMPHPFMDRNFVRDHNTQFNQAIQCFEDELSRQTYIASINAKINENLAFIRPLVHEDNLYFPKRESIRRSDEVFLDVGGFTGDTIREFHNLSNGLYSTIISLEPSEENFQCLAQTVAELALDKVIAIKIGAWNEPKTLRFQAKEMNIDNQITDTGALEIQVDRIDSILGKVTAPPITLMKFDINGAERRAIQGAKETIRKDKPRVVTRLHTKEDYFRIPLLLKEIAPEIKLYLRQRSYMSMMIILYGVFDSKF